MFCESWVCHDSFQEAQSCEIAPTPSRSMSDRTIPVTCFLIPGTNAEQDTGKQPVGVWGSSHKWRQDWACFLKGKRMGKRMSPVDWGSLCDLG
jgi:hypothetical protein